MAFGQNALLPPAALLPLGVFFTNVATHDDDDIEKQTKKLPYILIGEKSTFLSGLEG